MVGSINWSKSAYTESQIVRAAMTAAGVRGKIYNEPRTFGRSIKIHPWSGTPEQLERANAIAEMLLRFHGFKFRVVKTPFIRTGRDSRGNAVGIGGATRFWLESNG